MFMNKVINRYMFCIMQNFKINAHVCIYSLADLNVGHCVELTFLEGKFGRFLMLTNVILKMKFLKLIAFVKVKVNSTQMRIVFSS